MIKSNQLLEEKQSSEEVFKGELLHIFKDKAKLPDGSLSTREWIKHPGACAVIPVYKNGDIMMIRQFRYPVGQVFLEVPAGKIDAEEDQFSTAKRELMEETGLSAGHMKYVGHFYPGIGYSDEIIHIYVAWELTESENNVDEDEFVEKERISFRQAVDLVHQGEINDGKTVICLLRAWHWWQQHSTFRI